MTDRAKCLTWTGAHKFEARYTDAGQRGTYEGRGSPDDIRKVLMTTYVHDICVRCGMIVKEVQT